MPNSRPLHPLFATASLLLAICWLGVALPLRADEAEAMRAPLAPAPTVTDDADAPGQTRFAPTRRRAASPFAAALRVAETEHAEALALLRAELDAAPRTERASIQRRIETLKLAREARVVTLQLGEARRKGNASLADKLTRRLSRLAAAGASAPMQPAGGER